MLTRLASSTARSTLRAGRTQPLRAARMHTTASPASTSSSPAGASRVALAGASLAVASAGLYCLAPSSPLHLDSGRLDYAGRLAVVSGASPPRNAWSDRVAQHAQEDKSEAQNEPESGSSAPHEESESKEPKEEPYTSSSTPTTEEDEELASLAAEAEAALSDNPQAQAFDPRTGQINWDCPCLGGMAHGPCGEQFKLAFSCFVFSEAEPKGIDCVDKFQAMQNCFRQHPEVYAEEIADDEEAARQVEAEAQEQKA